MNILSLAAGATSALLLFGCVGETTDKAPTGQPKTDKSEAEKPKGEKPAATRELSLTYFNMDG